MGKTRYSSLDLHRTTMDLRSKALGMRLANVYDLNRKCYLLKFSRPGEKIFAVLEAGIRIHTTKYWRDKPSVPSIFTMKVHLFLSCSRPLTRS